MKKYVLFFLFVLCTVVMMAENYPHRSDYLWVTVPDHTDWLYECGDEANIEVQFYKYGIPREGKVEWEVGTDLLKSDRKGTAVLKKGRATINIGTA